jgi:Uma2 family endonuclease
MGQALEKLRYTLEEYLAIEDTAEERSEFYYGELFAMAGGTLNHNLIVQNIATVIRNQIRLKGKSCKTFTENVKLELIKNNYYVYPDMMLTCQPLDLQSKRIIQNPVLVAEVLSESTKGYDESTKKDYYLHLSTLNYYLLIEQDTPHIKLYSRRQNEWVYQSFESLTDTIQLPDLDISFQVEEAYLEVVFEADNLPNLNT